MDTESPMSSLCQFKEIRCDLDPLQPSSIVQLQVPSTSAFSVRSKQQRNILHALPTCLDENAFRLQSLATSGSLFFGRSDRHPKNILWRVLGDGKILELRSSDLNKSRQEPREAFITLRLHFPTPLKQNCIAIAESSEEDCLALFALTKACELYTFNLRKEHFCSIAASNEDLSNVCKGSKPATFSISSPHTLLAASSLQLVVSLSDGRLLLLKRNVGDDGSRWAESTYGDGQWAASLRGLVPWRGSNTIKYDDSILEQGTPTALAISPDHEHVFAVCLNHTLRIWNPSKAASVFSKDLLWKQREPHEIPKVMLDPGSPNVLQIFQSDDAVEGDLYYVVTFSPHDFGQFKFWGIRDPDQGEKGVRDLFPDCPFKPPDPEPSPESKTIWKVADFKIKSSQNGDCSEMWVLMKSNRRYVLYNLKFVITSLAKAWQDQWSVVISETKKEDQQPQLSDSNPLGAADQWLQFLFSAGRYSESIVKLALGIYSSERSIKSPKTTLSLQERTWAAISSQIGSSTDHIDVKSYKQMLDHEFTVLWQDIREFDKARWETLSLAYDSRTGIPWIAFADGLAAVRTCDKTEISIEDNPRILAESMSIPDTPSIELDAGKGPTSPYEQAVIIEAAATFRKSFSLLVHDSFTSVLAEELWLNSSYSVPLRIQSFYDQCDFANEIGSSTLDELTNALSPVGGFNGLTTPTLVDILDELDHEFPPEDSGLRHTSFGRRMLINSARGMIDVRKEMLSDLLALIIVVDMEIDREKIPMENFDAARLYVKLLQLLRQTEISRWLVSNECVRNIGEPQVHGNDLLNECPRTTMTILENLFAPDVAAQKYDTQSQSEALTNSSKDLLKWIVGGNNNIPFEDIPVYIQTYLLTNSDIGLASDFLQYQPSTAWSTYIKGRLFLARGEFSEAAICFEKGAFKLSRPSSFNYHHASHSLLSPEDALFFGRGLVAYYTHILILFDAKSCPSQMAHFAHAALQLTPNLLNDSSEQTATLFTSLFQASLQTTDFSTAYSALSQHPNPETLLPSFISALVTTPHALPQLLSFPFPPDLHSKIDAILSSPNSKATPKILSAWRLHHHDFRGAAAALLPPLQASQTQAKQTSNGLEDDYLTIINLLACAGSNNGWVLNTKVKGGKVGIGGKAKRTVVTIGDVRGGYQEELDRRSVIESGRFGFGAGIHGTDEMDVL